MAISKKMPGGRTAAQGMHLSKRYWEMIADELHRDGWSYGYTVALGPGFTRIYAADAHKNDGHRYVSTADTFLSAVLNLQRSLPHTDEEPQRLAKKATHNNKSRT